MTDTAIQQPIPVAFFADIFDSGQVQPFAVAGELKPPRNPIIVTREQEGQDFSPNASFRYNEPISWQTFVGVLKEFASEPFASKAAAPLFSPTTFKTNLYFNGDTPYRGFRCVGNATLSALAAVDADNKTNSRLRADGPCTPLYMDEAISRIKAEGVEAVIYTTASNKTGDRFRVVVPLAEPVDVETQQQAVQAVCRMLKAGWQADPTRNNAYTIFYVPGIYPNADNRFEHIQGKIRTAQEWITLYPPAPTQRPTGQATTPKGSTPARACALRSSCGVRRTPLLNGPMALAGTWEAETHASHILSDYRCLGSGRHHGLYTLALRLAMSAVNAGYDLTESELYDILLTEYNSNTPSSKYKESEIRRIASEGIDKGRSYVGEPAYKKREAYWTSEWERMKRDIDQMNYEYERNNTTMCDDYDYDDDCEDLDDDIYIPEDDDTPDNTPDEKPNEPPQRKRVRVYFDEYKDMPEIEYWDDMKFMPRKPDGTTALVVGKFGSHKTNCTLKMCMDAVMTKNAKVLYIACEGAYGIGKDRIPAHCDEYGIEVEELRERFEFMPNGVNLTNPNEVLEMIEGNLDFMPDIVVIDTLAQATPGVDSNNSLKGDLFGNSGPVAMIRKTFNCLVFVLCHPPKNNPTEILGHTSIAGNTDMILLVECNKDTDRSLITVTCTRNKDGEEGHIAYYKIDLEGVPVPRRMAAETVENRPLGLQKRDFFADEISLIGFACNEANAHDFDSGLSSRQLAEKQTPRQTIDGVLSDAEWKSRVNQRKRNLDKLRERHYGKGTALDKMVAKGIPDGKTREEWRWFRPVSTPETRAEFARKMMDDSTATLVMESVHTLHTMTN